jgi:hypothetical protein
MPAEVRAAAPPPRSAPSLAPVRSDDSVQALAHALQGVGPGLQALATSIEKATAQRKPVDDFFGDLRRGMEFLKAHRMKLSGLGAAAVLVLQAAAPNAAEVLKHALQAAGVQ